MNVEQTLQDSGVVPFSSDILVETSKKYLKDLVDVEARPINHYLSEMELDALGHWIDYSVTNLFPIHGDKSNFLARAVVNGTQELANFLNSLKEDGNVIYLHSICGHDRETDSFGNQGRALLTPIYSIIYGIQKIYA